MGRTKQTARKSTGGKAPRHEPEVPVAHTTIALEKRKGISKDNIIGKGKGGKGLGKSVVDLSDSMRLPTSISLGKSVHMGKLAKSRAPAASAKHSKAKDDADNEEMGEPLPPNDASGAPNTAEKTAELIASFNATSSKIDVR